MVEIFTVGGGDYLVNVFQAVAAWTGNGGYKSLLQVVMVMGLGLSAITLAFNQDWRAWINWFLGATLIYSCLMVPRLDVHVTDRLNPSLAPANVSNVPLGLALMASFTSQVGDYLTGSAEVVFGLPGDLNYSKNGMIYGARLYDATRSLRVSDPEFAANLDEHFRQCVFYDVLLGRYSMKELAETGDIWATIAPGSQARAQRFLTRDATSGQVSSNIVTCREAFDTLNAQWTGLIDAMGSVFGRQLYPNQTAALAKAKLFADLPVAYQYLTGVSANATEIFKQTLTINAMSQAMHSMSGSSGTGNVDVYAQTRADIQTERTYGSIASNAMKWVPLLNVVLTVLFYALFPVLFPLFLLPKTGPVALKGYVTGFFYLAAWGPLFVILHMMLMYKGAADMSAVTGSNGLSLASFTGMADVNSDIGLLAGYLIASVPFLAGGVAKGAMAISHHATSYLNPSQNAAEDTLGTHREITLLDRGKARGKFETADIGQRVKDHLLRHSVKVVGRCRAPPLRHVDADQASEMVMEWQLTLTGHVEARLERPGNDIAKPGCASFIRQRAVQVEARGRVGAATPAFVETGAELGKPAARRSILGFEADDRACRNRRAERTCSPRPPVVGIAIGEREDHDVERQTGVGCNVQRQNIPALHGELVNQALGQGGPALVRTFPATNDFDPIVGFGGFSLTLAVEHRLENRRAIAGEHQDHACFGLEVSRDDGRAGADILTFAFDGFDGSFGCSDSLLGTILVFEDRRMFVIGGIEFVEPRQFGFGQWRRFGGKPDQPFDQIVAGVGIKRGFDPGKTLLGGEGFGLLFHLCRREAF